MFFKLVDSGSPVLKQQIVPIKETVNRITSGNNTLTLSAGNSAINLELNLNGEIHKLNFTVGFYRTYGYGGDGSLASKLNETVSWH